MDSKKITLTNKEVLDLFNGLQEVSNLPGTRWSYVIAKNITLLTPEIQALQKAYSAHDEFLNYEKKREELAKKHAVKREGKYETVIVGGVEEYVIKDRKAFDKEYEHLKEQHIDEIVKRTDQLKDFEGLLEQTVELSLVTLHPDHIPQEITPSQLKTIMLIIDEKTKVDKSKSN